MDMFLIFWWAVLLTMCGFIWLDHRGKRILGMEYDLPLLRIVVGIITAIAACCVFSGLGLTIYRYVGH